MQRFDESLTKLIAHLNRHVFYLNDRLKFNDAQKLHRLKTTLNDTLRNKVDNFELEFLIYMKLKQRLFKVENLSKKSNESRGNDNKREREENDFVLYQNNRNNDRERYRDNDNKSQNNRDRDQDYDRDDNRDQSNFDDNRDRGRDRDRDEERDDRDREGREDFFDTSTIDVNDIISFETQKIHDTREVDDACFNCDNKNH